MLHMFASITVHFAMMGNLSGTGPEGYKWVGSISGLSLERILKVGSISSQGASQGFYTG